MSNILVFCSYEVGGLPYKIAEILNNHGIKAYYLSLSIKNEGHDSSKYHYGSRGSAWDLTESPSVNCVTNSLNERISIENLINIKEKYNISNCFATGARSYLLDRAGIMYKYWSYGSDIDRMLNWTDRILRKNDSRVKILLSHLYFALFPYWQIKKTINAAGAIMIAPYQLNILKKITANKPLFFLPHFIPTTDYESIIDFKKNARLLICKRIGAKQYLFSASRHVWSNISNNNADIKGSDIVIQAFSSYISTTHDIRTKLVLIEKGSDLRYSKELCKNLGIEKQIVWVKEMKRDELNEYYQGASICFGQFGTPVITGSVVEPLANGTVVISYIGEESKVVPYYDVMPPVINTKDVEVIADTIKMLINNHNYRADLEFKSWQWATNNCSHEKFVSAFKKEFQIEGY